MSDPVTIALMARAATASALAIRDIFRTSGLSEEEKEAAVAQHLVQINANARRSYEDYDPTLDADISAARLDEGN